MMKMWEDLLVLKRILSLLLAKRIFFVNLIQRGICWCINLRNQFTSSEHPQLITSSGLVVQQNTELQWVIDSDWSLNLFEFRLTLIWAALKRPKLKRAYHNAMDRQLWKGTLAELSAKDYFAVGAQAYFRDSQTRQEFSDYDPGM